MARILYLLADLPYFPGKMGLDFFNLRYLAERHEVGVVGPRHPQLPARGIENLRKTAHHCWFWPEPLSDAPEASPRPVLRAGLRRWSSTRSRRLLSRWPGGLRDDAALSKLTLLANLAPYLKQALAHRDWDVLVVVQSDTRPWLPFLPPHLPLAVYFHDLRCLAADREYRVRGGRAVARRRTAARRDEAELTSAADAVGCVSDEEAEAAVRWLGPQPHVQVVPVALDIDYFKRSVTSAPATPSILFTGHLSHPPNVDAVEYLLEQVWPRVRARANDVRLVVAGCLPDPKIVARCRARGAELHADPPDMRPYLAAGTVFVVPMRFGGGVRQKILEAWAMELPVVTTRMGAAGLPARDGVNCRVADDAEGLASAIVELLSDPAQRSRLAAAGRTQLEPHRIEVASATFERLILSAIERRREKARRILLDASHLRPDEEAAGSFGARVRDLLACWPANWRLAVLASAACLDHWRFDRKRVESIASDGWAVASRPLRAAVLELCGGAQLEELAWLRGLACDLVHTTLHSRFSELTRVPHVIELDTLPPPPFGRPRGWIVPRAVPGLQGEILEQRVEGADGAALVELYRRALAPRSALELEPAEAKG